MRRGLPALLLFALSCSEGTGPSLLNQLVAARMRWEQGEPQAYRYIVRLSCFCGDVRPVEVHVVNGTVVAVRDPATNESLPLTDHRARPVEGLFDVIQDAIGSDAHMLKTTYDPVLGFPTAIEIDYAERMADDEMYWTATGFTVLP